MEGLIFQFFSNFNEWCYVFFVPMFACHNNYLLGFPLLLLLLCDISNEGKFKT
jgi:hypothetical protein